MELHGGHGAWRCGAQVAKPLVLSLGSLHSGPVHGACSVCGGQCQVRNGVEAQDAILQATVAPVSGESWERGLFETKEISDESCGWCL